MVVCLIDKYIVRIYCGDFGVNVLVWSREIDVGRATKVIVLKRTFQVELNLSRRSLYVNPLVFFSIRLF